MKSEDDCFLAGKLTNLDSVLKSRDITLPIKAYVIKACLPSGHVWLWELDSKEGKVQKNWCLQTKVLEKILESPMDSKEIKPVNLKGDQPWIFTGSTDAEAEAEAPVFWSSDANRWLIGKVPDAVKNWGQRRRGHQRKRGLDGITDAMDMNLGKLQERVRERGGWPTAVHGSQRVRHHWVTAKQQNIFHYLFYLNL